MITCCCCCCCSYHQAQSSVLIGLRKLEELGVPTRRPEDYFAEMVKADDHMRKVRQCLLSRQKILEQKEKSRKMRELKKYGKKVGYFLPQYLRPPKPMPCPRAFNVPSTLPPCLQPCPSCLQPCPCAFNLAPVPSTLPPCLQFCRPHAFNLAPCLQPCPPCLQPYPRPSMLPHAFNFSFPGQKKVTVIEAPVIARVN